MCRSSGTPQRVGYDTAVQTASNETEPFGLIRKTFDIDGRFMTKSGVSAGVGYSNNTEDRTFRVFESSSENTFRLVADAVVYEVRQRAREVRALDAHGNAR